MTQPNLTLLDQKVTATLVFLIAFLIGTIVMFMIVATHPDNSKEDEIINDVADILNAVDQLQDQFKSDRDSLR